MLPKNQGPIYLYTCDGTCCEKTDHLTDVNALLILGIFFSSHESMYSWSLVEQAHMGLSVIPLCLKRIKCRIIIYPFITWCSWSLKKKYPIDGFVLSLVAIMCLAGLLE